MKYDREFNQTQHLLELYKIFLSAYQLDSTGFSLDVHSLHCVSVRYWKDVDRIHTYHPYTQKIDCHKIAGYLAYWINKLKPIHVLTYKQYKKDYNKANYVNECFALFVGLSRIYSHNLNIGQKIVTTVNPAFTEAFVYTLKYRLTTGDNLSLMYYLLEEKLKQA